jgi:hypothetical protein
MHQFLQIRNQKQNPCVLVPTRHHPQSPPTTSRTKAAS